MADYKGVRLRLDRQRHFALEYERGRTKSRYLVQTPSGLAKEECPATEFDERFGVVYDKPAGATALRLLEANLSAFIPGDGTNLILLETYIMTETQGQSVDTLDLKAIVAIYNDLARTAKRGEVKSFKSKGEALKRVEALRAELAELTPKQEENKKAKAAESARRLEGVKPKKAARSETQPATEVPPKDKGPKPQTTKKLPEPRGANAEEDQNRRPGGGKGSGIGAFCSELLVSGKSNEEVLAAVRKKFPDAKTSAASIAWYRNKALAEGKL